MKTQHIILGLAASLMFAGCQKEITGSNEQNVDIPEGAFYASTEGAPEMDAKTTLANRTTGDAGSKGGEIRWDADDLININGIQYKGTPVEKDTRHAIFTKVNDGDTAPESPYKAYYPATMFAEGVITLPAIQKYNAANSLKDVMPMYSESFSNKMLAFKNICGLLEINLKGTEKIKRITVSDSEKSMCGVCTIDKDGAAVISDHSSKAGVTLDCGEGVQLNNETGVTFYIAIPAGIYNGLRIVTTTVTESSVSVVTAKSSATILRNCIYTLELTPTYGPLLLPGKFSISATDYVQFSKGNLQATYHSASSSYTWAIAANQYDYVGNAAGNTTIKNDGSNNDGAVVDLFGWSTDATNYGINISQSHSTYSGDFKDWGTAIGDSWFTLSGDGGEWDYILSKRSNAAQKCGKATLTFASVKGVVILPDEWTLPEKCSFTAGKEKGYSANKYDSDAWTKMEQAGAVFLPIGGSRNGVAIDNSTVNNGYYWSRTGKGTENAYRLNFSDSGIPETNSQPRYRGQFVRLVQRFSK
ncbi:MAG: hypothetical protein KBT32_11595 [Bacteroidales bacterium]|nr:hypothetical protein [Candidatus Physcocola equi]